jgi:hypothetical protein
MATDAVIVVETTVQRPSGEPNARAHAFAEVRNSATRLDIPNRHLRRKALNPVFARTEVPIPGPRSTDLQSGPGPGFNTRFSAPSFFK